MGRRSNLVRRNENGSVEPFPADRCFREHLRGSELKGAPTRRLELAAEEKYCRRLAYRESDLVQYLFCDTNPRKVNSDAIFHSILDLMDNKDTNEIIDTLNIILAKMATKDDLAELRAEMATKDELNSLRSEMREGFSSVREQVRDIRNRLEAIEAELRSHSGFAKEIDYLLQRVGAIEKHLGIKHEIAA